MQSHLDLDPQTAERLSAIAEARGSTVQDLLKEFVGQFSSVTTTMPNLDGFENALAAFSEGTEGLRSVYTGSYSREDIYFDQE